MKKECYVCGVEITGHHLTYLPEGDFFCDNDCLIKYRKKRDENKKTKKSRA